LVYGRGNVFWRGEREVVRGRRHLTRVQVAFGHTTGFIARPRTVATDEVLGPLAAAVNDRGQIAMAYVRTVNGRRRAVKLFVSRGRNLGRGQIVSPRGGVNSMTVAVGPRGDIVVAWERDGRIEARIRRPHHHLGRIIAVGRGARYHTQLRAAVSRSGRTWLAWTSQRLSEGGDNGPFQLVTAVSRARGSHFQRARVLDRYDRRASDEASFALAIGLKDNGVVAWSSFDGQNFRARLATIDLGGRASITTLSQPGYDAAVGNLARGPRGDTVVVWARLDAVGELGDVVFAGDVFPDLAYAGEERVSAGDRARKPAVAIDPISGNPTVVWSQRVGPDGPGVPLAEIRTFLRASVRTP
jgi:hypothetical protein